MLTKFQTNRVLQCAAVLLTALVVAGFSGAPILRGLASFLIVEDSLRPAAAIVALGGQTPFREMEAQGISNFGLRISHLFLQRQPDSRR